MEPGTWPASNQLYLHRLLFFDQVIGVILLIHKFVQFHPTALADEGLRVQPPAQENAFLITEGVRGAGGRLYNQDMERFMPQYDECEELVPSDVVARSIDDQLRNGMRNLSTWI
ncbi:hypothetical protein R1flu_014400 [Riccia fluitans]|uniref:L-aspartate oxidase n=1 Tax=Riccia fluitans TaxID=41844 RepID=A0ABD1YH24_9MARC